ncbi:hypothetical protein ASZ90_007922 [hydrocarbon metagenome]|uniref:Uncharacterized protein n=1 Tax=hydrocarbon metagenome TaxID=938273 RepID=A0A0W8FNG9_9ZZZZ
MGIYAAYCMLFRYGKKERNGSYNNLFFSKLIIDDSAGTNYAFQTVHLFYRYTL